MIEDRIGERISNEQFPQSLALVTLLSLVTISCVSIRVEDGATRGGSLTSVNSGITIGSASTVTGESRSVNGSITVGNDSEVIGRNAEIR